MSRSRRPSPDDLPPDPFEHSDAQLVAKVAAGELRGDEAMLIAASGQMLAYVRRANGVRRVREKLEDELMKLSRDLDRAREIETMCIDNALRLAKHAERWKHAVRERREKEERDPVF